MPPSPTYRMLDAGRLRLSAQIAGEGSPPVLLLHGFPEFHYSWRHQVPALSERFRTVALDLPGYGASDKPRWGYSVPRLARDVVGALDALGDRKAYVVGHDWGGVLAWALAALHPDRVERLVVVNGPHPVGFLRGLSPRQMRRSWYMGFFQIPWLPERTLARDRLEPLFAGMRASSGPHFRLTEEEKARYREAFPTPRSFRAPLAYYRHSMKFGLLAMPRLARQIDCPVLSIWGEMDGALGKHLVDGFDRYAPNIEKKFVPDAGHWVQQERPDLVNQWLLEFLGRPLEAG